MRKQNKTNTYLQHEQLDLLLLWFYCVFVCHFLLDLHQIKIQIIYLQMKKKTRLKSTHKLYVSTEPSLTFCLRNRKQRPFIKAYNNATVKVHGVTPSFSISWYTFKFFVTHPTQNADSERNSMQVTHTFFSNSAFFRTNILNQELRLNSKVTAMHEHGLQGNILSHLWDNTGEHTKQVF